MAIVADRSGNNKFGVDQSLDNDKFAITPSDSVPLPAPIDAIFVGGAGNVVVKNPDGSTATFAFDVGGPYFIGQPTHVMSTNTTATGLVGVVAKALR